ADPEPTVRFCQMLEACGIDGLTIHGRLPEKFYSGPVAVDIIRAVRENLKIPVTANGGIFNQSDADALASATGCDRLMVARGVLGNPWLFRELLHGVPAAPSHEEILEAVESHVMEMAEFYGEQSGMILSRKLIQSYLCGRGYRHSLRAKATYLSTLSDFQVFLRELTESPPVPEYVNAH
ncbi:MAG: tRNA-dihydrouridine synthase, partial [Victivallales bacterium]|nr:tRNA-dihydrouridine synthase [Victivallales bacterium]